MKRMTCNNAIQYGIFLKNFFDVKLQLQRGRFPIEIYGFEFRAGVLLDSLRVLFYIHALIEVLKDGIKG
jgi:hypothetical protein